MTHCAKCGGFMQDTSGSVFHHRNCDRALNGFCDCDRRVCVNCKPLRAATHLAATLLAAHLEQQVRAIQLEDEVIAKEAA